MTRPGTLVGSAVAAATAVGALWAVAPPAEAACPATTSAGCVVQVTFSQPRPADGTVGAPRTPVLRAVATATRDTTNARFTFTVLNTRGGTVVSGSTTGTPRWQVPAGALRAGRTYTWQVAASGYVTGPDVPGPSFGGTSDSYRFTTRRS